MSDNVEKFASGEWVSDGNEVFISGSLLCVVNTVNGDHGYDSQEANAALISASPDMYRAIKKALPEWDDDPTLGDGVVCCEITYGDLRRMLAAIKKANKNHD